MENELTVEIFKYEMVDQSTADFLQQREKEIHNSRNKIGDGLTEWGETLKHAQSELANHNKNKGVFEKWYTYLGFKRDEVYRLINRYNVIANCDNIETKKIIENLPVSLSYEITGRSSGSTPAKAQVKEEVLAGEIETLKAYKQRITELETIQQEKEKKLKELSDYNKLAEEENSKLLNQLHQEKNKPVQIEQVERVVEVDKTDYSKLQQLQNQLETLQRKNGLADREINLLKSRLQDEQDDAEAYRKGKDELERLYQTKDDLSRQIESATSISGLVVDIENLLQGKLAPVKYSKAIYEQQDSPVVIENLREIIERVMDWCNEMNDLMPKESGQRRVIIDGQVVESELI